MSPLVAPFTGYLYWIVTAGTSVTIGQYTCLGPQHMSAVLRSNTFTDNNICFARLIDSLMAKFGYTIIQVVGADCVMFPGESQMASSRTASIEWEARYLCQSGSYRRIEDLLRNI